MHYRNFALVAGFFFHLAFVAHAEAPKPVVLEGYLTSVHPIEGGPIQRKIAVTLDVANRSGVWNAAIWKEGKWVASPVDNAVVLTSAGGENGLRLFKGDLKVGDDKPQGIFLGFNPITKKLHVSYKDREMLWLTDEAQFKKVDCFTGTFKKRNEEVEYRFSLLINRNENPAVIFYHHAEKGDKANKENKFYARSEKALFPANIRLDSVNKGVAMLVAGEIDEEDGEIRVKKERAVEIHVGPDKVEEISLKNEIVELTQEKKTIWKKEKK